MKGANSSLDEKYLVTVSVHRFDRAVPENELDTDSHNAPCRADVASSRITGASSSGVSGLTKEPTNVFTALRHQIDTNVDARRRLVCH